MRGAKQMGWRSMAAGVAVALMGAAPIPPGPKVLPGTGYEAHVKLEMQAKTLLTIPGRGSKTVPSTAHLAETQRVMVLAVAGGAATRVRITYVSVDAQGQGGDQDRAVSGHTYEIQRTQAGDPPKVTEQGKAVTGKLARKIWDDVSELLAPVEVHAFTVKVLAQPGHSFAVPPAIYPALTGGTETKSKLLSATMALVKVEGGKATVRITAHEQSSEESVTLDLKTTRTEILDASTGRTLHADLTSTLEGQGTISSPIGAVGAKMSGGGVAAIDVTWDPKAPAAKGAGAAGK